MSTHPQPNKPALLAAALIFAFLFAVLVLMLTQAEHLVRYGLIGKFWFIALILLGSAAAIALFALFNSYAVYQGKVWGGTLRLGGPGVLMLVVLVLGYQFAPSTTASFDLHVFLRDGSAIPHLPKDSSLRLDIGATPQKVTIGSLGEARFLQIPNDQRGKEVVAALDAQGYALQQGQAPIKLDAGEITLQVRAKILPLRVQVFEMKNGQRKPVANARLRIGKLVANTDQDGQAELPVASDADDRSLRISAEGYGDWTGDVTVAERSGAMQVILSKRK